MLHGPVVATSPGCENAERRATADPSDRGRLRFSVRRAIAIDPGMATAYNGLGVAYARMGQPDKAVESWRKG